MSSPVPPSPEPIETFDVVVIGSGPAGHKATIQAAKAGKRVLLVERETNVGGACVHRGTIPSKTLRETALAFTAFRRKTGEVFPITVREDLEVASLMTRMEEVVKAHERFMTEQLRRNGATKLHGRARFLDDRTIAIEQVRGNVRRARGEVIIIATGSQPRAPADVPIDHDKILDSDSILSMTWLPRSLTVLGAGVIASEYASIFAALGVKVTLIEGKREILGFLDDEITRLLRERMQRLGVTFRFEDAVERVIDEPGPGVGVVTRKGAKFRAGKLLVAAGRTGNVAGLGLETIGVRVDDKQRIVVDERFRTSVPNVLAAGDVLGFPGLASTGIEQGRLAVRCLFGACERAELARVLPYGLYTIPEVGTIGVTEEEARERALDFRVGRAWYRENARGQIVGDVFGLLKLVVDAKTRALLGVHIVGEKATELVHLGQAVMELGGTVDHLGRMVMNFPTLSVLYKRAALNASEAIDRRP